MSQSKIVAKARLEIKAPAEWAWEALTTPALFKKFFFDVDLVADWKVGGTILYRGTYQGKTVEDKGVVLGIAPPRLLIVNYLAASSGLADKPENYQKVTYALEEADGKTTVTVTQENLASAAACADCERNWNTVLGGLKALLEK